MVSFKFFLIISHNVVICPKIFSNRSDSHYQWHVRNASSDTSAILSQTQMIGYGEFVDHTQRITVGRTPSGRVILISETST